VLRGANARAQEAQSGPEKIVKIETIGVRVGRGIEPATGEVAPAVHLSTTYERDVDGEFSRGYDYVRPTIRVAARSSNASRRSKAAAMQLLILPALRHRSRCSACCGRRARESRRSRVITARRNSCATSSARWA
jgi:hypothetical protein